MPFTINVSLVNPFTHSPSINPLLCNCWWPRLINWPSPLGLQTTVKPAAGGEPAEASELPDSSDATPSAVLLDTTEEHRTHLFDLNCRICTGKITPPGEPPKKEPAIPLVSTTTMWVSRRNETEGNGTERNRLTRNRAKGNFTHHSHVSIATERNETERNETK